MKSSGAKCTEQTAWILAQSPVLSISIHEWNPLSSPFHGFRSWWMEIPFISSFVLLQPNATHRCTMFSSFANEKHCAKEKSAKMAVLYWRHSPLSPVSPPCAVLYRTGSEISRICRPQKKGRKIDREFIFSIFTREQHEDLIKQIKKNLSYTL